MSSYRRGLVEWRIIWWFVKGGRKKRRLKGDGARLATRIPELRLSTAGAGQVACLVSRNMTKPFETMFCACVLEEHVGKMWKCETKVAATFKHRRENRNFFSRTFRQFHRKLPIICAYESSLSFREHPLS